MKVIINKYTTKFSLKQIIKNCKFSTKIDYSYNTEFFLTKSKTYEEKLDDVLHKYEILDKPISGFATPEKTEFYMKRNIENIHKDQFKQTYQGLNVSSLGLGSYLGKPDDLNDFYLYNAVKTCVLSGGINMIDTAINYRYMRSELAIGKAIQVLVHKYKIAREEMIIASKVGFVPEDAINGKRCHFFVQELIEAQKMDINDVVYDELKRPVHCIHPEYIKKQLDYSLNNLNLETLDILYLHNVFESQVALPRDIFTERLLKAFEVLEEAIHKGLIRNYGLASWNSFRVDSNNVQHSSIQKVVELATKVGGKNNGLRFIQAPINLTNPEVFIEKYQEYNLPETTSQSELQHNLQEKKKLNSFQGKELKNGSLTSFINNPFDSQDNSTDNVSKENQNKKIFTTVTAMCNLYKINLISSSPLLQGLLLDMPLENKIGLKYNPSKHLQIIRSIPAESLKSTLVGMKSQNHIKSNLEVLKVPRLTPLEFYELLTPKKRSPHIEKEFN
jgi:aryl-alcohol dehydrogenase-like predicted oxidoreductase